MNGFNEGLLNKKFGRSLLESGVISKNVYIR